MEKEIGKECWHIQFHLYILFLSIRYIRSRTHNALKIYRPCRVYSTCSHSLLQPIQNLTIRDVQIQAWETGTFWPTPAYLQRGRNPITADTGSLTTTPSGVESRLALQNDSQPLCRAPACIATPFLSCHLSFIYLFVFPSFRSTMLTYIEAKRCAHVTAGKRIALGCNENDLKEKKKKRNKSMDFLRKCYNARENLCVVCVCGCRGKRINERITYIFFLRKKDHRLQPTNFQQIL